MSNVGCIAKLAGSIRCSAFDYRQQYAFMESRDQISLLRDALSRLGLVSLSGEKRLNRNILIQRAPMQTEGSDLALIAFVFRRVQ